MNVDTSTDGDHPHAHEVLLDIEGNGKTTPSGEDSHVHVVERYEVQPWSDSDAEGAPSHTHRILGVPLKMLRLSGVGHGTGRAPAIRHPSMGPKNPRTY